MPRVLLLCEYPTLNGGEQSLLAVLPHLISAGYAFNALAPPEGPLADAFAAIGVRVLPLNAHNNAGVRATQSEMRSQIAMAIDAVRPNLVHANSLAMGRLAGPVAVDLNVASIGHIRDIIGLSAQAVADLNYNRRLIAVSQAARDYHIAQGIDAARTHVVYNGVDIARFAKRAATGWLHEELGLPPGAQLIGAIGQLVLRKGHDVLAAAATALAARHPHARYVFVGSRFSEKAEAYAHEAALRAAFSTGPLAGRGHFLGVRSDVAKLLAELTMLVHPARQEPLGRVLLEAAAAGVPVVATDVGGTREIFPDGAAQIVPPGDAVALSEAIELLLGDAELRQQTAATAAAHARREFNSARTAENLAAHYAAMVDEAK